MPTLFEYFQGNEEMKPHHTALRQLAKDVDALGIDALNAGCLFQYATVAYELPQTSGHFRLVTEAYKDLQNVAYLLIRDQLVSTFTPPWVRAFLERAGFRRIEDSDTHNQRLR